MDLKDKKGRNIISLIYKFEKNTQEEQEEEEIEEFDEKNYFESLNKYRIFGEKFVRNNENNCTIIYQGNEIKLRELLPYEENDTIYDKSILIKLKVNNKITNMTNMFKDCKSLYSIPDISNLNTSNITKMEGIFENCESLSYISGLLEWDVSLVTDMSKMFYNCKSLSYLEDISKWNASKIIDIGGIFHNCISLSFLPNIIEWKIPKYIISNQPSKKCVESLGYFYHDNCINSINII